jgi:hypothetical protein
MATFTYQNGITYSKIGAAKSAMAQKDRVGFKILPIRQKRVAVLRWQQKPVWRGLQQLRGPGGAPSYVNRHGGENFLAEPGYYGEYISTQEGELLARMGSQVGDVVVNIADIIADDKDYLIKRELDAIEYIIWQLVANGTFTIIGPNGSIYSDTFAIQTHTASDWSSPAGAPLKDLRTIRSTKGVGKGLNFGRGALYVMNSITAQYFLDNQNSDDLAGKLVEGGNTANADPDIVNRLLIRNDLGTVLIYDNGWHDEDENFHYYVPTDKVIIVGRRTDGEEIGEYTETLNLHAESGVGPYDITKDYFKGINAPKEVPGRIENHRGHNGGPVLWHPGAIIVMSV